MNLHGNVYPWTDNVNSFGISSQRLRAIYSASGVIQTSDERTKTDIEDAKLGLDFINHLRPVSYRYKVGSKQVIEADENGNPTKIDEEEGKRTHWGLIAQEVKQVVDEAGVDFGGWLLEDKDDPDSQQSLRYDQFIAPLIKAVQELSLECQKIKPLQEELDIISAKNQQLQNRLDTLLSH